MKCRRIWNAKYGLLPPGQLRIRLSMNGNVTRHHAHHKRRESIGFVSSEMDARRKMAQYGYKKIIIKIKPHSDLPSDANVTAV